MEEKLIPHYKLEGADEETLIYETSYVASPATGKGFLMFSGDKAEQKEMHFAKEVKGYQRMTSGVWFAPDTKYLRVDAQGNYYTVSISKEDLKAALIKYLKGNYANIGSLEHGELVADKFVGIEHWIIEDANTKSPVFGLTLEDLGYAPETIPVGTVMRTAYIADEEFWNNEIMTGNVTGYSISGLFTMTLQDASANLEFNDTVHESVPEEVQEEAKELIEGVIETKNADYTVQEGFVVDVEPKEPETKTEEFSAEMEPEKEEEVIEEDDTEAIESLESDDNSKMVEEDYKLQLEALKQEYEAKLQEKDKENKELRKSLNNQPLVKDTSFSKFDAPKKHTIKLGQKVYEL